MAAGCRAFAVGFCLQHPGSAASCATPRSCAWCAKQHGQLSSSRQVSSTRTALLMVEAVWGGLQRTSSSCCQCQHSTAEQLEANQSCQVFAWFGHAVGIVSTGWVCASMPPAYAPAHAAVVLAWLQWFDKACVRTNTQVGPHSFNMLFGWCCRCWK
jgi:hypothetical protein